jgi:MoxR-like ATPase
LPKLESNEAELAKKFSQSAAAIKAEVSRVIIGQDDVVELLLLSLFVEGHCLIVGVPGLAKTLLVSTLARTLDLEFNRIQFTPDLMPSDITGTEVIQEDRTTRERIFKFVKGPIFTNVLLADEINRTPPKTQSALLQGMQEKKVTVAGQTYPLPDPFFVLATQNPIEQEGTYPLPEAQLDRFLFHINITYPGFEDEKKIVTQTTSLHKTEPKKVLTIDEIKIYQNLVRNVPVADSVVDFSVRLARATRPNDELAPDFIKKYVTWGAGPRASQSLVLAAKARALLKGTLVPSIDDIRAVAHAVFRHRLIPSFQAQAENISLDNVVDDLLRFFRT